MTLTRQQALAKIEELKAFIEQEENKVWKPENGKKYFCINGGGVCLTTWFKGNVVDADHWEMGNCYRTEEEAKAAVAKQKALVRINRYIEENFGKWEPDWSAYNQDKYLIYYNHSDSEWDVESFSTLESPYLILSPLKDRRHAEQLIKDMDSDLRIVLGIK